MSSLLVRAALKALRPRQGVTSIGSSGSAAACARGHHGPLQDAPPEDRGACVNIDHRCLTCGRVIATTSWTKAAWLKRKGRAA